MVLSGRDNPLGLGRITTMEVKGFWILLAVASCFFHLDPTAGQSGQKLFLFLGDIFVCGGRNLVGGGGGFIGAEPRVISARNRSETVFVF